VASRLFVLTKVGLSERRATKKLGCERNKKRRKRDQQASLVTDE
jgi:hypothetical protein